MQAVALATACMADQSPTADSSRTPIVINPTATTVTSSATRRWELPALRAWDVAGDELVYVSETNPSVLRVRSLLKDDETTTNVPAGRQVTSVRIVGDAIAYVAAVGDDRYRPSVFEIHLYGRASKQDAVLQTLTPVIEVGQDAPLSPGLLTSKDRTTLIWTAYGGSGQSIDTEIRRRSAVDGSIASVISLTGVVFPIAMSGSDIVVWKRAAGAHNSPTAIDTHLIKNGQDQLLLSGAWSVDVAADGRAVLQRGDTAQVRERLTGAVQLDLRLDSQGAAVIAGKRIGWCSEQGFVTVFDLSSRASQRYPAKGCAARIFLEEAAVTWLESDPGKFALVRLPLQ